MKKTQINFYIEWKYGKKGILNMFISQYIGTKDSPVKQKNTQTNQNTQSGRTFYITESKKTFEEISKGVENIESLSIYQVLNRQ